MVSVFGSYSYGRWRVGAQKWSDELAMLRNATRMIDRFDLLLGSVRHCLIYGHFAVVPLPYWKPPLK